MVAFGYVLMILVTVMGTLSLYGFPVYPFKVTDFISGASVRKKYISSMYV